MKKKAGLILAALLLCAVLAAGAEGDWSVTAEDYAQYGGRWVLTHMISGGQEYLVSDFGMEAFLDLKEDGTVDANQGGEITPGHWKAEDGKVWVELEGSIQSGPVEDGKMRLGVDEDMLMIFSREDGTEIPAAPGPAQAELITAESPEELSGTWQAEWMMMEGMKVRASSEQIMSAWELYFGSTDQQVIIQGTHAVMFGTEQEFTFRNGRLEQVPEETAGMDNPDYFSKFLQLRDDGTLSLRLMGMEILCSRTGDAEPMPEPTPEPTEEPTPEPTPEPTEEPTPEPTKEPTPEPTKGPAALAAGAEGDWSVTAEDYAQYGGRWVLTHMISGGQEYLVSDFGMEAFLDLKEDGTVDANQGGETTPGHWKAEDGKVWVELEGSIQSGPVEDGKMRLGVDEDMLMIFSREDGTEIPAAPGPAQAELITAESPEELSGTWQAEWMMMEGMKVRASSEQIMSAWELYFGSTDQQVIIQGTHAVMFGTEQEFTFRNGRLEQVPEETAGMDNPDYFSKFLQLRDDGTLSLRLMGMEILCSRTGDAEPMPEPTPEPTEEPTPEPTPEPTEEPMPEPTPEPTEEPTPEPTPEPTEEPTPEPTPEPTEEPEPEPDFPEEDLTGEWYAVYLRSGRVEGHPRQKFNTEITLTLNEDHTGSLLYLGTDEEASWTVNEEGKINFGDNTLTLREDGFLILRTEKGGAMVFSRNREARWTQKLPEE